ncbi:NADH-ubiquinone oxidoreductase [Rhizosaccharibacter radicis]|uniref:NADH-ubiquinone oxidoreductase n=1 Tax=Rhizosaccharibacter radicis TaxID=2782605 RepID=A0ABT1VYQ0_9PROT|nr:NADH-ubiquinone oxidoreductase [Acetobacteraceae bacterium KSS12]
MPASTPLGAAAAISLAADRRPVHVIGASGRSGAALCRALAARGVPVVPVVRDARRWSLRGIDVPPRVADLRDIVALADALRDGTRIASTAHARHVPAILSASPPDAMLVCLGSTRKFTRWPDRHGNGVLNGERALLASGRPGVILHPTMIYGAEGENNVQRLAALLRRLPLIPLPAGGRALVQPIHQSDVTGALLAALASRWDTPASVVIAGPDRVSYRGFVAAVGRAAGLKRRPVVPVPAGLLMLAAPLSRLVPRLPQVGRAEIRRLLEDKAFDIAPMREQLGIEPLPLTEGLRRTFAPGPDPRAC